MEGHITATYTLIYRFLKHQSQNKAAEAVKKAAKSIVVLRDDTVQEGPPLEDIIKEWKKSKENTKSDEESSSEESDSSEDTSSDSEDSSNADSSSEDTSDSESEDDDTSDDDDSSDDSDSEEESPIKKSPQKPVERDTSATLSSAGEKVVVSQPTKTADKNSTGDENEDAESDSSDSDSSDSDDSSQKAASDKSDAESSSDSSDSSSSSESSDEEEDDKETNTQPPSGKTPAKQPSSSEPSSGSSDSSSESSSESEDNSDPEPDTRIAKKRKISESGAAVATAHPPSISQPIVHQKKQKPPPNVKERFQRVKVQNIVPDTLLNNGYEARGGASNDYGERAHRDLIVTRGAGFRKEKNKKKRGSYRGGEITMENHSIKFDS